MLNLEEIKDWTLNEVASHFKRGRMTLETAEAYCKLWNETTVRFTFAKAMGNSIIQLDKETQSELIERLKEYKSLK